MKREEEKAAQEEFDEWKDMFEVEEEGDGGDEIAADNEGLLEEFVTHIKYSKVVILEDLAQEFGLNAQEAVDRVKALAEMGQITGVFDDRGKFIYITEEEMRAVGKFVVNKGRVSIAALAAESNKLINLTPGEAPSRAPVKEEDSGSEGEGAGVESKAEE